jgi:putative ABC transport system permease protein
VQIGIYFLLPLSVAVIHSILTLPELNQMVMKIGDLDVSRNILLIIGFIVVVYGGYFLATYWCSLGIIKEKRSLS